MPGSAIVKPDLPSSLIRWVGTAASQIPPTTNQVVAIPIVHDWGPELADTANAAAGVPGGLDLYTSLSAWEAVYGSGDTAGRDAVVQAFLGMNVPGGGGAGGVITPRMVTGSGAKAAITRQNTTPTNALTLTAKWKGTKGNFVSLVIEADPVTAANDRLRLLFNGVTMESYSYLRTDITSLAAAINARSKWVVASGVVSGVALSPTTGTALTGGNDGSTVTVTEYALAQTALEFKEFGVFAPFNLTDTPTKVQIATWAANLAQVEMRPFRIVFGGPAAETLTGPTTELSGNPSLRDEHIVRLAYGTLHDDFQNKDFSTAQLAPRLAGVIAARGESSALTGAQLGGLRYVGATGPPAADLVAGRDLGLTLLRRISDPDAEVGVSQGVSTFISKTTVGKPYEFFSEPRIVGILDTILRRITTWGNRVIVGDVGVTDDSRREVSKEVGKILDEYEGRGLAQPGTSFVNVFDTDDDSTLSDTIPFQFGFKPTRTANFLIGEGRIS